MEVPADVVSPEVERRLERALAGADVSRRLVIAELLPGLVGILEVDVRQVGPQRTYKRKRGGEGTLARVVLGDASGEIDIVLWDEETVQTASGPFQHGACLLIAGATVKAGYRGGLELGLGMARVTPIPAKPPAALEGQLVSLGPTRIRGSPPNVEFQADAGILVDGVEHHVVLSGQLVLRLQGVAAGTDLMFVGLRPNPAMDLWWWAPPEASVQVATPLAVPRNP